MDTNAIARDAVKNQAAVINNAIEPKGVLSNLKHCFPQLLIVAGIGLVGASYLLKHRHYLLYSTPLLITGYLADKKLTSSVRATIKTSTTALSELQILDNAKAKEEGKASRNEEITRLTQERDNAVNELMNAKNTAREEGVRSRDAEVASLTEENNKL